MKKSVLYALAAVCLWVPAVAVAADDDVPALADARGAKPAAPKATPKPAVPRPAAPAAAAPRPVAPRVAAPKTPLAGAVAAEVNDEKIMRADLERMIDAIREDEPSLAADLPEARAALDNIRQQVLDNLIEHRLLVQEARRRNIVPPIADIEKSVNALRGPGISDDEYKKLLAKEGKTPEDVRAFVTDELAVRALTAKLTSDITLGSITSAEVTKFYNENPEQWAIPATAKAHHILIALKKGATREEKDQARKRAVALLKRAQAKNTDFVALATQYSEEPAAKQSGGDLGEFEREQMVKSFSDAVWAAKIGDVFGPVETDFGFHIIKVDARTAPGKIPIEKVSGDIREFILRQKMKDKLDKQLQALQSAAVIRKFI